MRKYIVYPDGSRGLGNIMNDISGLTIDELSRIMVEDNCTVSSTNNTYMWDNLELPVFNLHLSQNKPVIDLTADKTDDVLSTDTVTVTATVTDKKSNAVNDLGCAWYVDGAQKVITTVNDGVSVFDFKGAVGEHTIRFTTSEGLEFGASSSELKINVLNTTKLTVTGNSGSITAGDYVDCTVVLTDETGAKIADTDVDVYVNDILVYTYTTDTEGSFEYKVLPVYDFNYVFGDNTVSFRFGGDDVYYMSSATVDYTISKITPTVNIISLDKTENADNESVLNGVVQLLVNKDNPLPNYPVTAIYDTQTTEYITDDTGKIEYNITVTEADNYTVSLSSNEQELINNVSKDIITGSDGKIRSRIKNCNLTEYDDVTVNQSLDMIEWTGLLVATDYNDKIIADTGMYLSINGKKYPLTTHNDGSFNFGYVGSNFKPTTEDVQDSSIFFAHETDNIYSACNTETITLHYRTLFFEDNCNSADGLSNYEYNAIENQDKTASMVYDETENCYKLSPNGAGTSLFKIVDITGYDDIKITVKHKLLSTVNKNTSIGIGVLNTNSLNEVAWVNVKENNVLYEHIFENGKFKKNNIIGTAVYDKIIIETVTIHDEKAQVNMVTEDGENILNRTIDLSTISDDLTFTKSGVILTKSRAFGLDIAWGDDNDCYAYVYSVKVEAD